MRKKKRILILSFIAVILVIGTIYIKCTYSAEDTLLSSSEYTIKDKVIYAVPTTLKFKASELISKIDYEKSNTRSSLSYLFRTLLL